MVNLVSRWPWAPAAIAATGGLVAVAAVVAAAVIDQRLASIGRKDLAQFLSGEGIAFGAAMLGAIVVGAALMIRRPANPVGWLFFGMGVSIALTAFADNYAAYGAVARPGSLPGASLIAVWGDGIFAPWLMLVALIMFLTPTGRPPSARWRPLGFAAVVLGLILMFTLQVSVLPLDPPLQAVTNPTAVHWASGPIGVVRVAAVTGLMLCVLLSAASLLLRFRTSDPVVQKQLRWLAIAAVPVPLLVLGTWVASATGHREALGVMAGGFLLLLPLATGLAISQYHLYEVDRLLSRSVTYALLSLLVVGCYAAVVIATGQLLGAAAGRSPAAAVVATLLAVSAAAPARGRLQNALDRAFNRRQFDAAHIVRRYTGDPESAVSIEQVLRRAVGDPALRVSYWIDERRQWVTEEGVAAEPGHGIEVMRQGMPVARVSYDGERFEEPLIRAAVNEARAELENSRLRAAIALQLVEVRESRARIVEAQRAERSKIERNLHDGAQQRLLAIALQLRAAEVSGDSARTRRATESAVAEIQLAVRELRDLANGLHPAILNDGGLAAAFDDLASRTPVPVHVHANGDRFAPAIEAAAWFIACEVVTNAVKHARASAIEISASRQGGQLRLVIEDDGAGGADPQGTGLRGIADRAEAAGGSLTIRNRPGNGTLVIAEIPCAS